MANKKASVIFLMVLISFTCAQLDRKTTQTSTSTSTEVPETTSTPTPVTDPTTVPTTTAPTTTAPTTTAPTTTAPSTTSSTTPSTTTVAPSTTTVAPSTSTVAPSTTTPTPTPLPSPDYKKWWFADGNQTCIIVQLAVQLNLNYTKKDDTLSNVRYNVPVNNTDVKGGSCLPDKQSITVKWGNESTMRLEFTANNSQFWLSEMYLSINASEAFTDAKDNQIISLRHNATEFPTTLAMSYHCNKVQTIALTSATDSKQVTIANASISHVQFEAFHKQNTNQFSTARDCEAIDTPDIVPIAVGCALAGLVVVVLIAYLVGRRRAQARGYLSM